MDLTEEEKRRMASDVDFFTTFVKIAAVVSVVVLASAMFAVKAELRDLSRRSDLNNSRLEYIEKYLPGPTPDPANTKPQVR